MVVSEWQARQSVWAGALGGPVKKKTAKAVRVNVKEETVFISAPVLAAGQRN
jgi:hypothetical protein